MGNQNERSFIRSFVGVVRSMPDALARALNGWVLRAHSPIDIDGQPVCAHCKVEWPCPEFVRVDKEGQP
jgi:hypothetical protein